jgi:hypothetical protein
MLEIKGIRCWLKDQVNNNRLPEFQVETLNEHTVRAYISSDDGLEFSIKALLPSEDPPLVPHVYVNGRKLNALVSEEDSTSLNLRIMGVFNSPSGYLPFMFSLNEFNGGHNQ